MIQVDDYYPFGLTHANGYQRISNTKNGFKYNGKEEITDLDLNWYDYGARMYMNDLGRFSTQDPHADNYHGWTPYNYVANNPVLMTDPDGKDWVINRTVNDDGTEHFDITFIAAVVNKSETTTTEDIVNLVYSIQTQIEDAFTIAEDGVTTSVNTEIRFSKDGEVNDNEHTFEVVDNMASDELGEAVGRTVKLNSSKVWSFNGGGENQDMRTLPHEAGHTAGLEHPEDQIVWYSIPSWFTDTPSNQYLDPGQDDDNVMFQSIYAENVLEMHKNNNGKGFKINANQARILFKKRDNK